MALVDAALSYLTRMAFRSCLSGDGTDIAQGFLLPRLKLRWDAQLPAVESRGRDLAEGFLSSGTGEASGSASPHLSGCSRGLGSTHSRRLS